MGEVGGVDEGVVADDLDGEGHGQLFGLATHEEAALLDLLDHVLRRVHVLTQAGLTLRDVLEVRLMGGMKALQTEEQPGDATLQEGDADVGEAVEYPVVDDAGAVDRQAPG